jgi:hypothetical protein
MDQPMIATDELSPLIDSLHPVSLETTDAAFSLQTRVDRKYIIDAEQLRTAVEPLVETLAVLEIDRRRSFRYRSIYFDTPQRESYLGTARRRRRRYKVRTRTYLDTGRTMLEVKVRGRRGTTVKTRIAHSDPVADHLGRQDRAFVDEATGHHGLGDRLAPVLATTYRRTTLIETTAPARVTIDDSVHFCDRTGHGELPGRLIVETKSSGPAGPIDRALWAVGVRPTPISKFGTGLAALHPELPSNKWHRTINGHVTSSLLGEQGGGGAIISVP